jgi:hypothetical protein
MGLVPYKYRELLEWLLGVAVIPVYKDNNGWGREVFTKRHL